MVKLLGFRITPFFLFILGLECLALLVSIYMGTLLYQGQTISVSLELIDRSFYSGIFLILLLSILTPGFFYQTRVIDKVKKSISANISALLGALMTMVVLLFTSNLTLDLKSLYIAALLSACAGLIISQARFLNKYWRFLVRAGVN
jgi:lysylphosphatidylglycerol synthetase-like protein (DUF2156 family)